MYCVAFNQQFRVCKSFGEKLWGIGLFVGGDKREPVFIDGCDSIHTYGVLFPIDICFIDTNDMVLYSERYVLPKTTRKCKGAKGVFERRSSAAFWPRAGQRIKVRG